MFNKGIYSTTLTGEAADRLFTSIIASGTPDQSFLATLRALLRKRLPNDKTVQLSCGELTLSEEDISAASVSQCMCWFVPDRVRHRDTSEYNIFIVHAENQDAGTRMLEVVRANAGASKRHMSNYTRRDDLAVFYARKLNALFYTDDTGRNTVIFTDNMDLKHFHALQMMIPKYLPELFADSPLTESETALLKSMGDRSSVIYENLIEAFAREFDIRSEIIRSKLTGFETAFERLRLEEIRSEIDGYQANYDSYLSALRDCTRQIQERQYTLTGLACAINQHSGDSELMEYFMCNKNLTVIRVRGTMIEFVAHGYADIYDADAFEKYVTNHGGYMYSQISTAVTKPQMERLYRDIFGGNKYRLRLCAAYTADMRTGLKAVVHYTFPPESKTYLPNPHIQQYGCIGSYAGRFQEYMQKRDYVGAIDQAVVSARNLNFYDSTVISAFAAALSCTNIKCIEKSDGTLITPLEAITETEGGESCPNQ